MDELVSVLLCAYKEPISYFSKSLESVLKQTYKNLEVIVILDNPNGKELMDYLEHVSSQDKRIKYYVNKENIGLACSLNAGLKKCHGVYIARMDADDICFLDRIEKQISYLKLNNLDMVGGYVQMIDMEDNVIKEIVKFPTWSFGCNQYLKSRSCLMHPTWVVKKTVYNDLNGYRDFKYCEDYDFLIRAASKHYKMASCPHLCIKYRVNCNGITQSNKIAQKINSLFLRNNLKNINDVTKRDLEDNLMNSDITGKMLAEYFQELNKIRNGKIQAKVMSIFVVCNKYPYFRIVLKEKMRIKLIMFYSSLNEYKNKLLFCKKYGNRES